MHNCIQCFISVIVELLIYPAVIVLSHNHHPRQSVQIQQQNTVNLWIHAADFNWFLIHFLEFCGRVRTTVFC